MKVSVDGSKISAEGKMAFPTRPPVIKTVPSSKRVAVCPLLTLFIEPVAVKEFALGSLGTGELTSTPSSAISSSDQDNSVGLWSGRVEGTGSDRKSCKYGQGSG